MATSTQCAELLLDLGRYTLTRAGRSIRLEKQPMELLILLVEKRGQLVTREQIVARLWGKDVFLDTEGSVNTAIRKIRIALHDHPDHPHVIETVVGKGYRFIAPITVVPAEKAGQGPPATAARRKWQQPRVALAAGLIGVATLGFVAGWKWLRPAPGHRPIQSLAVLPLQNLSGDPAQEYFADGMTETLITDVAKISGLRVISHTTVLRYRRSGKTLPEIARELKVDAVVEGSVARQGDRVRVTAQLVEAATDRHLWAETYERSTTDLLALQDEVARAIARQVDSTVTTQGPRPALSSQNPAAQDAYLKGLHESDKFSREGLDKSIAYFQEAVREDPGFAQAWAGLARDYNLLALFHYVPRATAAAKAQAAATKAVELDPNLSEAHAALGGVLVAQWSWAEAESEFRRSVALNPSNAEAHQSLGYLLAGVLHHSDEGIQEMARALDLDPLSPSKRNSLGAAFYWAGRYEDALRTFQDVPDGDANTERRHRRMAEIYHRQGLQGKCIDELLNALRLTGRDSLAASVQQTYRDAGYLAARKAFFTGDIRERIARTHGAGYELWIAADYALLGDKDNAFRWLDKAFAHGEEGLMYVAVEIHFASLRTDPRFAEVLRRTGLS